MRRPWVKVPCESIEFGLRYVWKSAHFGTFWVSCGGSGPAACSQLVRFAPKLIVGIPTPLQGAWSRSRVNPLSLEPVVGGNGWFWGPKMRKCPGHFSASAWIDLPIDTRHAHTIPVSWVLVPSDLAKWVAWGDAKSHAPPPNSPQGGGPPPWPRANKPPTSSPPPHVARTRTPKFQPDRPSGCVDLGEKVSSTWCVLKDTIRVRS